MGTGVFTIVKKKKVNISFILYGGDGDENEDIGMFGEDDFEMHASMQW